MIKEESEDVSSTGEEAKEVSEGEVLSTEEQGIEQEEELEIEGDDVEKEEEPPLFVYFDVEAKQDTGNHVANLLVAETEDGEMKEFKGERCIQDFVNWLEDLQETPGRKLIVVAHNFKGYDSYFLLEEYYKQMILPKQLVNGAKILFMSVGNIHFKDSLCFLPMALSAFSETFGLTELKKGFFPHFFNRSENQEYVGPFPDAHYYDPDGMSTQRREEFDKWYKERKEEEIVFDFQKELTERVVSRMFNFSSKGVNNFGNYSKIKRSLILWKNVLPLLAPVTGTTAPVACHPTQLPANPC